MVSIQLLGFTSFYPTYRKGRSHSLRLGDASLLGREIYNQNIKCSFKEKWDQAILYCDRLKFVVNRIRATPSEYKKPTENKFQPKIVLMLRLNYNLLNYDERYDKPKRNESKGLELRA